MNNNNRGRTGNNRNRTRNNRAGTDNGRHRAQRNNAGRDRTYNSTRTDNIRKSRRKENKYRVKKAMLKRVSKRLSVAFAIVAAFLLILIWRIAEINYKDGDKYSKAVLDHQSYTSTELSYKRGQIQDRNGTVLAYSEKVYNLIFDPKIVLSDDRFKEPTIQALEKCFSDIGINRMVLENLLTTKPDSRYEQLYKGLTGAQVEEFKNMLNDTTNNPFIKGVWFEDSYIRKYPFSTLACNVVGYASSANGGELGLEYYYDDELSGVDGVSYSYVDDNLDVKETTKNATDGNNIISTIDYGVQSIIEKRIKAYNDISPSKTTAVLVMDPNNGEVLGMASTPVFDLNNPRSLEGMYTKEQIEAMSDQEKSDILYSAWKNYCVSNIYEPGSTFKPFTVAAGLEEGVVHDGDILYCNGYEEVGGYTIKCHVASTIGKHGDISIEQALMQSCNPAMMQIAARLGNVRFAGYQSLFGFGSKTGIDLPGEEEGLTKSSTMSDTDLATNSFGQNVNVNMIQMAAAFSSLINGGNYYQPHIVKRIEKPSGEVVKSFDATLVKQTVTSSTSQYLKRYLKSTVDSGLAMKAGVTGYSIGGKTGTAEKNPRSALKWLISFIGFAPVDNPKFVIYVIIDEPDGTTGTSGISGDVLTLSHDLLSDLLPYMNVYKDVQADPVDTSEASDEQTVHIEVDN